MQVHQMFGFGETACSSGICQAMRLIRGKFKHRLMNLNKMFLYLRVPGYARVLHRFGVPLEGCFFFIDCCVIKTCAASLNGALYWNGECSQAISGLMESRRLPSANN